MNQSQCKAISRSNRVHSVKKWKLQICSGLQVKNCTCCVSKFASASFLSVSFLDDSKSFSRACSFYSEINNWPFLSSLQPLIRTDNSKLLWISVFIHNESRTNFALRLPHKDANARIFRKSNENEAKLASRSPCTALLHLFGDLSLVRVLLPYRCKILYHSILTWLF